MKTPYISLKVVFQKEIYIYDKDKSLSGRTRHFSAYTYFLFFKFIFQDRLCGLVIRVPGYRSRGPGFDSWRCQIFCEIVGLERSPLSLVRIIEELLQWKSSGSG
jgi:hypothetical protein